jgi:hypothetical protein
MAGTTSDFAVAPAAEGQILSALGWDAVLVDLVALPNMTVRLDSPSAAEQPLPGGRRLRAVLEGRHDGY